MKKEKIKEEKDKKESIWKKIKNFFKKNKKPILISLGIILFICILCYASYRIFIFNTNDKELYEDFQIVSVDTKEKGNRNIKDDSTFIIEADNKVNVDSIRNKIYVEPAIDYEIKKVNAKKYELIPTEGLTDNTVYKISQVDNETKTYSWAFETERKLSVVNYDNDISDNNTLKITFSMEDVENINDAVTISPSVKGTWVKHNSTWVFENKEKFTKDEYTVSVSNDIKAGDYTLESGISFKVYNSDSDDNDSELTTYKYSMDGINTFTSKEQVKIVLQTDEVVTKATAKAKIYQYSKIDDFKDAILSSTTPDVSKLSKLREENVNIQNSVITLNKSLSKGWYVVEITYNKKKAYQYIQISDVSAYTITTERDTLVWVIKDGKTASNISVSLNNKTVKSDENGLAKFSDFNNNSMSKTYITVDSSSKNPTLVLTQNYDTNNYPNGYLYTDRPIYKPTDEIQVWGYVPVGEFVDKLSNDFTIVYGNSKKKVKVDANGIYKTTIKLKDYVDSESMSVELYYKDTYITSRSVEIYDYVKPTYTYSIDMDKHVYYANDTIKFNVNVEHITGLTVKNKTVKVVCNGTKYTAKTNDKGIASFSIKTSFNKENTSLYDEYDIDVYTGDSEDDYENYQATTSVIVYNYNIDINDEISGSNGNYSLTIKSNKIDFNKTEKADNYETKYGDAYNKQAKVEIYKRTTTRTVTGTTYDDYEGKMVDEYDYNTTEDLVDTKTVTLKDGKATLKDLKYKNTSSDDETINYYIVITMKDTNNRSYSTTEYLDFYNSSNIDDINNLYADTSLGWYGDAVHNYNLQIARDDDNHNKKANSNEKVEYALYDKKNKKVSIDGKLLTVFYKEKIVDTKIISNNDLSFTFSDKLFPGSYVAAAYLTDGKVYSVANDYVDYNEEEKESTVTITPNKEEYTPGEEVELKINVKDKDGKGLVSTVNISVVDESIFEVTEDDTSILSTIYSDRYFAMDQSSTDRDYYYPSGGGYGSSGAPDNIRYNFKDTAYFKTVDTDSSGNVIVKFTLPDNITKYRITVHAANKQEYVGVSTKNITVTQDFFVESVTPSNVKYNDDLVVNAISHGKKASGTTNYTFEVNGKTLTSQAAVDTYTSVNFGSLPVGTYDLKITAENNGNKDAISNKLTIIGSSMEVPIKTTTDLNDKTEIKATKNPITLEIYDKKLDKYLTYINYLGSNYSSRLDKRIGIYEQERLTKKFYDNDTEYIYTNLSDYVNDSGLATSTIGGKNTDVLLSALVNNYASGYLTTSNYTDAIVKSENYSRDYYSSILGMTTTNETSLSDLDSLRKNDKNRDEMENILLATSYAFLGDYDTAKDIYKDLNVKVKDKKIYINDKEITNDDISSALAVLSSMINKNNASKIIDILIDKNSTSMYLNFAIISYIENNTEDISSSKSVTVSYGKTTKKVKISGFKVERIDIDNSDLQTLKFKDASSDLKVSYYYNTGIDNIDDDSIKKDIKVSMKKSINKNDTVKLNVKYTKTTKDYVDLKIAIPNGLSLNAEEVNLGEHIYISARYNSYIILTIDSSVKNVNINLPFTAVNDGKYVFEPVTILENNIYHVSSQMNINIKK